MCETVESEICGKNINKIKNSIVFTLQLFSTFNDTTLVPRVYKKTQITLLTKIKSFVVFKINEGQLIVISSDEEDEVII